MWTWGGLLATLDRIGPASKPDFAPRVAEALITSRDTLITHEDRREAALMHGLPSPVLPAYRPRRQV